MKPTRIESLLSWFFTGAILIAIALFFAIRGWFMTEAGAAPLDRRGAIVDPQIALAGASLLFIIGLVIIAFAVVARLRMRR
jgi:hypothetical protein